MKVPKFRSTRRLVLFLRQWDTSERFPAYAEEVFFNSKENEVIKARNLVHYARRVGKLNPELEAVLKEEASSVLDYAKILWNRVPQIQISEELQNSLSGYNGELVTMATMYQTRLPKHLEDTLNCPYWALQYSRNVLHGRLPFHLEDIFFKDPEYAAKYAFQVIRGYAPAKLPEHLHSFMIMKSYEQPDNTDIKFYLEASESDPNKMGNSNNKV